MPINFVEGIYMGYKRMEQQVTDAISALEAHFQTTRSIDVYEGLAERVKYADEPTGPKPKLPDWFEPLSSDEKEAVGYMWTIASYMRYESPTRALHRIDKIFVPKVNHELIAFASKVRKPN